MTIPPIGRRPRIHYSLIYVLSVLFAFHNVLIIYTNSSYIEQFIPAEVVGTFYMIGSALAVFGFLFISRVLRHVGNVRLTLGLAITEIAALLTLGLTTSPALTITAFVIFLTINPLIFLNMDIFSETLIGDAEETTGHKRGIVLTLMSAAGVLGPLLIGPIVGDGNLHYVYFASALLFSIFVGIVLTKLRHFPDPAYSEVRVLDAIRSFWHERNIRFSLLAQFTLQVCFSWMVIYTPLYLSSVIGLSWTEIGTIISVGLLAYVLLEFPIGHIADNYIGEKEMMATGFAILAVSVASISFVDSSTVFIWMALMFAVRVGASLVEATIESYFFKHTKGNDTNYLSFFRTSRPLGIIFGGLLGSASLLYLPFSLIFVVLGAYMLFGIFCASQLADTK